MTMSSLAGLMKDRRRRLAKDLMHLDGRRSRGRYHRPIVVFGSYVRGDKGSGLATTAIRLSGSCLEETGFQIGDKIDIEVESYPQVSFIKIVKPKEGEPHLAQIIKYGTSPDPEGRKTGVVSFVNRWPSYIPDYLNNPVEVEHTFEKGEWILFEVPFPEGQQGLEEDVL